MAAESLDRINQIIARQFAPTRWDKPVQPLSDRVNKLYPDKLNTPDKPQRLSVILKDVDPDGNPYLNFSPVRAVFLHKMPGYGYKLLIAYDLGENQPGFVYIPFRNVAKMDFSTISG